MSRGCTGDHRAELGVPFFPSHPQGGGVAQVLGHGGVPIPREQLLGSSSWAAQPGWRDWGGLFLHHLPNSLGLPKA